MTEEALAVKELLPDIIAGLDKLTLEKKARERKDTDMPPPSPSIASFHWTYPGPPTLRKNSIPSVGIGPLPLPLPLSSGSRSKKSSVSSSESHGDNNVAYLENYVQKAIKYWKKRGV